MNLEEDILIDNFLNRTLSKEANSDFIKRMDDDQEFEKKVRLEQQLRQALNDTDWSFASKHTAESTSYQEILKSDDIKKLRNLIKDVNTSYQEPKKSPNLKWILLASAATIALFISLAIFNSNPTTNELYKIYSKDANLPTYVSREDGNENDLIKAQLLFENKEFEKSLLLFKKELKNTVTPEAGLYLYTGIAQMELSQFEEAEDTYNTLIHSDLIDAPKGLWYKALLYLKMDQPEKSKLVLEEITERKLYNYKKAEKLLKKLS